MVKHRKTKESFILADNSFLGFNLRLGICFAGGLIGVRESGVFIAAVYHLTKGKYPRYTFTLTSPDLSLA